MPFDLRITITGLCLFVPDNRAARKRLHVLLLGHHRHTHFPKLIYDKAYENSPNEKLACRSLDGVALNFGDHGDVLQRPVKLDEIVDLDVIAGVGKLDPRFVDRDPRPEVAARISLNAGSVTRIGRSAEWVVRKDSTIVWKGKITTEIDWTIRGVDGGTLREQWEFLDLATGGKAFDLELHPIGTPPLVEVSIYNSLPGDLPPFEPRPMPPVGTPAEHFDAYYRPHGKPPVLPLLNETPRPIPGNSRRSDCKPSVRIPAPEDPHEHEKGEAPGGPRTAHTATCIMAQAPV